ncbi:hypothetical protein Tco_0901455 [Tanacetum coccineum]
MFDEDAPEDQPNIAIALDSISELVEKHNSNDTEQINAIFAQLNQIIWHTNEVATHIQLIAVLNARTLEIAQQQEEACATA